MGLWAMLSARLAPDGVIVEGTCSEVGPPRGLGRAGPSGPRTLTFSARFDGFDRPSDLAERLPKTLIHRNVPGEPVHAFLRDFDRAWAANAPLGSYGSRQRWIAAAETLAGTWPVASVPRSAAGPAGGSARSPSPGPPSPPVIRIEPRLRTPRSRSAVIRSKPPFSLRAQSRPRFPALVPGRRLFRAPGKIRPHGRTALCGEPRTHHRADRRTHRLLGRRDQRGWSRRVRATGHRRRHQEDGGLPRFERCGGLDHLLVGFDAEDRVACWLILADAGSWLHAHWRWLLRVMVPPQAPGQGLRGRCSSRAADVAARDLGLEALHLTVRGGTGTEGFLRPSGLHRGRPYPPVDPPRRR